jgi:Uncharacterized conserved protein
MQSQLLSIPFDFPGIAGVHCLFSTSYTGDMSLKCDPARRGNNVRNRQAFMRKAGFSFWAEINQVHGDIIVPAHGEDTVAPEKLVDADGLYTCSPDTGLIVKTADCQPILFARDDGKAVAGLHVGWRGNAMNFPGSAVKALCRLFSCTAKSLYAVRGPSLGPAAAEFVNFEKEWPPEFAPWFDPEKRTVNLWQLTKHQLTGAGMHPDAIYSIDMCTRDMDKYFFSYRRKDPQRHISAIWFE